MLALMDRAIQRARDRADPATGIDVARRLVELEPLHEEAPDPDQRTLEVQGTRASETLFRHRRQLPG